MQGIPFTHNPCIPLGTSLFKTVSVCWTCDLTYYPVIISWLVSPLYLGQNVCHFQLFYFGPSRGCLQVSIQVCYGPTQNFLPMGRSSRFAIKTKKQAHQKNQVQVEME